MNKANRDKNKQLRKFIFLIFVAVLALLFFLYTKHLKEEVIDKLIEEQVEALTIDIDGKRLTKEKNNLIYSSTLRPQLKIFVPKNIDITSLSIKIDNSENVLMDEFYGETNLDEPRRELTFQPSYMITPQVHYLIAEYQKSEGELESMSFKFVLIFNETFDESLENSRVWIIPEGRSPEWFRVQNGKLLVQPVTEDRHSSLAFLYAFSNDVTIDFELIPIKDNVSTVFYFLEFGSFVIGSNGNEEMVLVRKGHPDLFGRPFKLHPPHRYHIRITRENFEYKLVVKELFGNDRISPTTQFLDESIILAYEDLAEKELTVHNPSHIGFSIWQNSEGVFIDDIFITGFSN